MQKCQSYADLGQPPKRRPSAGQWVSIFWAGPSIEEDKTVAKLRLGVELMPNISQATVKDWLR